MIGNRSEGIKGLTSMIGNTTIKLVWIFPELDFFGKLKPFSPYFKAGFQMKNKFSLENVLTRKTLLDIILNVLLKYIFYIFVVIYCYHDSIITTFFQIFIITL